MCARGLCKASQSRASIARRRFVVQLLQLLLLMSPAERGWVQVKSAAHRRGTHPDAHQEEQQQRRRPRSAEAATGADHEPAPASMSTTENTKPEHRTDEPATAEATATTAKEAKEDAVDAATPRQNASNTAHADIEQMAWLRSCRALLRQRSVVLALQMCGGRRRRLRSRRLPQTTEESKGSKMHHCGCWWTWYE